MIHKLKTKIWSSKLRIRTGEVVQHENGFYANKTGINSEPEMNSNSNWLYIGEVEKDGSFILRSGENLTEQEIIQLQEILGIGNNLDIGFAADGTLDNGFDVPMEKVLNLVFNQLDFEYELDEENGVILIKKVEGEPTGNFVPLPGTELNKPISGNVQVTEGVSIFYQSSTADAGSSLTFEDGGLYLAGFSSVGSYSLAFNQSGTFEVGSTAVNSKGLQGTRYFGAKYDALSYVQKQYVDGLLASASATVSGIVDNVSLQELGGVDKKINGLRIGRGKLNNATSTAFGLDALNSATTGGIDNSAFGTNALKANTAGDSNSAFGTNALAANTTGWNNNAFGAFSLAANTTGLFNSSFGDYAMQYNTSGQWNAALGASALRNNTTGQRNFAAAAALYWNTSGSHNTAVGMSSAYANSTGNYNSYLGRGAGYDNGLGSYNIGIGAYALMIAGGGYTNGGSVIDMNRNVFIGTYIRGAQGMNDTLAIDNKGGTVTDAANALLYGGFSVANRFLKINGVFSINPTYLAAADGTYTKNLVAKPDGTFGWEDRVSAVEIYSTNETKTNGIWVDGKIIYRKFVSITIPAGADTSNPFSIPIAGAFEVISFEKCFMKIDGGARKIPPAIEEGSNNKWSYDIMNLNDLRVIMGVGAALERVISGVVEYTKPAL